jgi:hypothetical protein
VLNVPRTAVQLALFVVSIAGVGLALALARRNRKLASGEVKSAGPSGVIQGGWALFVLLAGIAGVAEPILACRMFLRAYLIRAWCLRGLRRGHQLQPDNARNDQEHA